MTVTDILDQVRQSGEVERFVAENGGSWNDANELEFKDRIVSRYGPVDDNELQLLLEQEKQAYQQRTPGYVRPVEPLSGSASPVAMLEHHLKEQGVSQENMTRIFEKFRKKLNRSPVIVFMGGCGVGKTSTCNALFGRDTFKVGLAAPETSEVQADEVGELILVDVPGLGEGDQVRDEKWRKLYKTILRDGVKLKNKKERVPVDAIVWVLTANDRKLQVEADFYKEVFVGYCDPRQLKRIVYAINQVDIIHPAHGPGGWNSERQMPGLDQFKTIKLKQSAIAEKFDKSPNEIIPYSAAQGYNLDFLLEAIARVLPRKQVPFVVVEAEQQDAKSGKKNVKKPVKDLADEGLWEAFGEALEEVVSYGADKVKGAIRKGWEIARSLSRGVKDFFGGWF